MNNSDIIILGAGAAGLAAGIHAAEAAKARGLSVLVLEGARKPGAKILVSGGGRCNVTNQEVTEAHYWGGPRPTIRNVLRAFDERRAAAWMRSMGVDLKIEPGGKLFPVTDQARTVLDGLLRALESAGGRIFPNVRIAQFEHTPAGFKLTSVDAEVFTARRVIMATGGLALPKSGSDGAGIAMAETLGHKIVPLTPALVALRLRSGDGLAGRFADWAGITLQARIHLEGSKEEIASPMLFTHFGASGPAAMDFSRVWLRARLEAGGAPPKALIALSVFETARHAEEWMLDKSRRAPKRAIAQTLTEVLPDRIASAMAEGLTTYADFSRAQRADLAKKLTALPFPVEGDRGYTFAETSAGGVELREIDSRTMESRIVPGLHLCGEMLDVDGRIGGFNFQWAWASGYLAGRGAVAALAE